LILTYKIRHGGDFSNELRKAERVANFALKTRTQSSYDVKHLGLKSMISNQILRKYSRNRVLKEIRSVKLTIPSQGVRVLRELRTLIIPCLGLTLNYHFRDDFEKVNQVEVGDEYAYVSVTIPVEKTYELKGWIGVDRNTTGNIAVVADPETGKVLKLGKSAKHIHDKYRNIRRSLQSHGKYRKVKEIKNRESRVVRDLNNKVSRKIVDAAKSSDKGIKLELLEGIRKTARQVRSFRYALHSWSFYQLERMIEYKAKLLGVPVAYVDPAYTSQTCSRCGQIGDRNGKNFKCSSCGHVEDADANASFNIAVGQVGVSRSAADRDAVEGSTDTPREATPMSDGDLRTPQVSAVGVCQSTDKV
jgi:putative transposase